MPNSFLKSAGNPSGFVLHRGSVAGEPFVCVATLETDNRKTGNMVQIWFLLENVNPVAAVLAQMDKRTICRECPFAGGQGCYVNVGQAPLSVWKAFHSGSYPNLAPADFGHVFTGRKVRFGAYGNPTLLPLDLVERIARTSAGWTGYFHDWKTNPQAAEYGRFFMASTETASSFRAAVAAGFRVFHVSPEKPAGAIECLSDAAGMTCEKCRLCDGRFRSVAPAFGQQPSRTLPSVWINPHGSKAGRASAVAMAN
jgi:hypothetical protein